MERYRHTQRGTLVTGIVAIAGSIVAAVLYADDYGFSGPDYLILALLILVGVHFSSLTVTISGSELRIRFGPGWIGKRIRIRDIRSVEPVRNSWYHGWGIRKIRHGWLFNVSGFDAVELKMNSGKLYRVGTDQPQELARLLQKAVSDHPGGNGPR